MNDMCGKSYEVLSLHPPSKSTNIVGLQSPDGSQDGVWFFPVTAIERETDDSAATGATDPEASPGATDPEASPGATDPEARPEATPEATPAALTDSLLRRASFDFKWELSRQSETVVAFDLGQLLEHKKYGYRGARYSTTCPMGRTCPCTD